MNFLNILTWNCRSLYPRLSQFKIKLYTLKPHIACLCETWIKDKYLPSFINYTPFFLNRPNRQGGGLLILVRNDVPVKKKNVILFPLGKLEVQAVTIISSNNTSLDIFSVYNPNHEICLVEYDHYLSQLQRSCILVGDFNAHNSLWNSSCCPNMSGRNLASALLNFPDICLLTPLNFPTYYNVANKKHSTLDLCLLSSDLYPSSTIDLVPDDLGSDHSPILIAINFRASVVKHEIRGRWIYDSEAKWREWAAKLPVKQGENDDDYDQFALNIIDTSKQIFKMSKTTVNPKYSKPWWSKECEKAVRERHHAKQTFKKHPILCNLLKLRRAEAVAKKVVKDHKRDSFRTFCTNINSRTPVSVVWSNINRLSHKFKPIRNTPLIVNGEFITSPIDKANTLANIFEKTFSSNINMDRTPYLITIDDSIRNNSYKEFNDNFTIHELNNVLQNLKDTAAGEDTIHNKMLKNLPYSYVNWFLRIINCSYCGSTLPNTWKSAQIIAILKLKKEETDPESQRPISLLSCPGKVMEKLVNERLIHFLESTNGLSNTQGGFRRRLCTLDQIARLEHHIRCTLQRREVGIAVFIDFSRAFDSVWHTGLLYKLASLGLSGKLLRWLQEYLSGRSFKVFYQGATSSTRPIISGVPQGSILSPILYSVMTSDLPKLDNIQLTEYADDIMYYVSKPSFEQARSTMQKQIDSLQRWTKKWGLKVNILKTKSMIFTNKTVQSPSQIKYEGQNIDYVLNFKYLGMTFDSPRLNWTKHIDNLNTSIIPRINVLKSISHYSWGSDRQTLLNLYVMYIRSIINYGSMFYTVAPYYKTSTLDKAQNQCLRLAIGARRTSPITALHIETNIPPLNVFRELTTLNYYSRLVELPQHLSVKKDLFSNIHYLSQQKWTTYFIPPLIIRCFKYLNKINMSKSQVINVPLTCPLPPWTDLSHIFKTDFPIMHTKNLSPQQICSAFRNLQHEFYSSFIEIYTDGSVFDQPETSTAAAIVLVSENNTLMLNWRLAEGCSIFVAELFAIWQALVYATKNITTSKGIVVYTDSLSSVITLQSNNSKTHLSLTYKIYNCIQQLQTKYPVRIQYIPAHKEIEGNELADLAAKAGHMNSVSLLSPTVREDRRRRYKALYWKRWETGYQSEVQLSGKGIAMYNIKKEPCSWPWACHKDRVVETALAKLRVGHVGLNDYLYKIKKSNSNLCTCGQAETRDHYLLACPLYDLSRGVLKGRCETLKVPFTVKNLLGGGPFKENVQHEILGYVSSFLQTTGKLTIL